MSIGLAIFVKTPGLSPVKTRLAKSVGREVAEDFYKLSLKATASFAKAIKGKIPELKIYWAVAEVEGLEKDLWNDFETIPQGDGTLGDRLSFVYDQMLNIHHSVCFIGADSPHLDYLEISNYISTLRKSSPQKFLLGETYDGGFYFFGGSQSIPKEIWTAVHYSTETTCHELCEDLNQVGFIELLSENFDIDRVEDFDNYKKNNFGMNDLLPEQRDLLRWVEERF